MTKSKSLIGLLFTLCLLVLPVMFLLAACGDTNKKDTLITITVTDKVYNGAPAEITAKATSGARVSFAYRLASDPDVVDSYTTTAPVNAGKYVVRAISSANDKYNAGMTTNLAPMMEKINHQQQRFQKVGLLERILVRFKLF